MQISVQFGKTRPEQYANKQPEKFEVENVTLISTLIHDVKTKYEIKESMFLKTPGAKHGLKVGSTLDENCIKENDILEIGFPMNPLLRSQWRLDTNRTSKSRHAIIKNKIDDSKTEIMNQATENYTNIDNKLDDVQTQIKDLKTDINENKDMKKKKGKPVFNIISV